MKASELIQLALKGYKLSEVKELIELCKEAETLEKQSTAVTDASEHADASVNADVSVKEADETAVDYKKKCEDLEQKLKEAQKNNTRQKVETDHKTDDDILIDLASTFFD